MGASLFPLWLPSQDATQYQLAEHSRQLLALSGVPSQIAVLQEQVIQIRQTLDSLKTAGTFMIVALLGWMGKEIFQFLGGKIGFNGKGNGQ